MTVAESSPKPKPTWRRWLVPRFTLRTLLIVTTIIAVLLGTWATRARRQYQVCQAVEKVGGRWEFASWKEVENDASAPWSFRVLPKPLRVGTVEHVWRSVATVQIPIDFPATDPQIAVVEALGGLPSLATLEINVPAEFNVQNRSRRFRYDDRLKQERVWGAVGRLRSVQQTRIVSQWVDPFAITQLVGLPKLTELKLRSCEVEDSSLEPLRRVHSLRALDLRQTRVSDKGLAHIVAIDQLESLSLAYSDVTSRGVAGLGRLVRLKKLDITGLPLDDEAAAAIAALPSLEILTAHEVTATDETLAAALRSPELRVVRLGKTNAGRRTVAALAKLPRLEIVDLDGATIAPGDLAPLVGHGSINRINLPPGLPASEIVALLRCPKLTLVTVRLCDQYERQQLLALSGVSSSNCNLRLVHLTMTTEDWRRLAQCPTLGLLLVSNHLGAPNEREPAVDDEALQCIGQMQSLFFLKIDSGQFTDAGFARMSPMPNLRALLLRDCEGFGDRSIAALAAWGDVPLSMLDLSNSSITDAAIDDLAKLKSLETLVISDTQLTPVGIARLKQLRPGLSVESD